MAYLSSWFILGAFIGCAILMSWALLLQGAPGAKPQKSAKPAAERHLIAVEGEVGRSELRKQLSQAGFHHPKAALYYLACKIALAAFGLIAAMILLRLVPFFRAQSQFAQLFLCLVTILAGYFLPVTIVDKRRAAWLKRIELALPDALDFILICVEAGQSADLAVKRTAAELASVHPELAAGFMTLTEALAAGAERQEAWLKLAQDTENDDLRQLATIIVQSTTMGTPVAHTLRVFSADLRDRRVRRVEERANILPTKMTLGTMMFTVPPLLILLLAPALYRIASSF